MNQKTFFMLCFCTTIYHASIANDYGTHGTSDSHESKGTRPAGQKDCGGNYMLPGDTARMGSHSFIVLGSDGPNHLLLDHRSGTPPHNYQIILKVRVDPDEMNTYKSLLKTSKKTLPAITTIYYDKQGNQVDRTFFCLHDLNRIFGTEKKQDDVFEPLFPIRASWQKDADFEGAFNIKASIVPVDPLIIERNDVEILVSRYLPSYLSQTQFRKMLKESREEDISRLSHAPLTHDDQTSRADSRSSYASTDGSVSLNGEHCPSDYHLKQYYPRKTIHTFVLLQGLASPPPEAKSLEPPPQTASRLEVPQKISRSINPGGGAPASEASKISTPGVVRSNLLSEVDNNTVLAVHYYDQAPHNFQTVLHLTLSDQEMDIFRKGYKESSSPLIFQTQSFFCMADLRELIKNKNFNIKGTIFKNSNLDDYRLGPALGELDLKSSDIQVVVNRTLASLLDPQAVARDVFDFVDVSDLNSDILVDLRYLTNWNFLGRPVRGYRDNRCYLTRKAARVLTNVQKDVSSKGYSLLLFDCYRPQKAVDDFVDWAKNTEDDNKMKNIFYPAEPKDQLFKKEYIASRSGHTRGSVVDVTLVKRDSSKAKNPTMFRERPQDCRNTSGVAESGQLDMGTTFDCFSELSHTNSSEISREAKKNRLILKQAMEKHGFKNYPKEWWHFALTDEPYKDRYFDFEVY